ncbi:SDR family NAD(P)-dependent oxidoreductase, partial [Pseudomonas gingeri]|uniref:SDR family NAD(P)-dependent oxidoreductase n=1 Tax=Pseudomonas gingeri TaxID=117681 RepID=UPI0034E95A66
MSFMLSQIHDRKPRIAPMRCTAARQRNNVEFVHRGVMNMARILITGSSDGLGQMAARLLVEQGHGVVLHARDEARGAHALAQVPGAETVLCAD